MSKTAKQYKRKGTGAKKFVNKSTVRNSTKMGYDSKWKKYRFRFLHHNPICYSCGAKSTVVDHIVPARVDKDKYFWKIDNYMPLCKPCHDYVTGKFDRLIPPKTEEKIEWVNKKRLEANICVKIVVVQIKH